MSNLKNLKKGVAEHFAKSATFNVDNGSGSTADSVLLVAPSALTVTRAYVVPDVTTIAAAGSAATVQIGTAVAGAQIVAATNLTAAAVGVEQALTLATPSVAAGSPVVARHTGVAATVAGEYHVEIWYTGGD